MLPESNPQFHFSQTALLYLPVELSAKQVLKLCYRCHAHLDPGKIPHIFVNLTQSEQRLLTFVRIIKIQCYIRTVRFQWIRSAFCPSYI